MEFLDNKPIYQQIADFCAERIMDRTWLPDARIPSVKELSVEMAVNNRTVLKAYDEMQSDGVIYQKRGLGYFVAPDAVARILERRRTEFFSVTLPGLRRQMSLLGITPEEVLSRLR